jgi:uncharacterized paraquat-inducible protein A
MIDLTFTTAFMLYLLTTIILVLGIWLYSHYRLRNRKFLPIEKELFVCEFCHFAYVEQSVKKLNRCPQCNLINKKNRYLQKK